MACCTEKEPHVVFNVPQLIGKNIDEVRSELRVPDPESQGPFIEPPNSDDTDIYKIDSYKLIIDFDINSREVTLLMIVDQDGGFRKLGDLLKIGNLDSLSTNYKIKTDRSWAPTMKYDNVAIYPVNRSNP